MHCATTDLKEDCHLIQLPLLSQYFVMISENSIHCDLKLLLDQFPRLVPRAAPNFLQTFVVKQIRKKIANLSITQGTGRHGRYSKHIIN